MSLAHPENAREMYGFLTITRRLKTSGLMGFSPSHLPQKFLTDGTPAALIERSSDFPMVAKGIHDPPNTPSVGVGDRYDLLCPGRRLAHMLPAGLRR